MSRYTEQLQGAIYLKKYVSCISNPVKLSIREIHCIFGAAESIVDIGVNLLKRIPNHT